MYADLFQGFPPFPVHVTVIQPNPPWMTDGWYFKIYFGIVHTKRFGGDGF